MKKTLERTEFTMQNPLTERQILNRLRKIDELKAKVKEANDAIKALQSEILGDAESLAVDNAKYTLSYKDEGGYRLDTKLLKQAHPDIIKLYSKWTPKMTFRYSLK